MKPAPARPPQFSIATILLVTSLLALCFAVLRVSTFWGTAALLLTGAALVRCAIVGMLGPPQDIVTISQKFELFVESAGAILVSLVAAIIGAFLSTTVVSVVAVGSGRGNIVLGVLAILFCVTSTIAAFGYVFCKLTFPIRR